MPCMRSSFIAIALLLLSACNKSSAPDCFKKTGEESTESRNPGSFNELQVYSDIDVDLVQDSLYRIELEGGKNLLPKIVTSNDGRVLTIDNGNSCNFVRGYKKRIRLTVYVPSIKIIRNKGVGQIRIPDDFSQDRLEVYTDGVGDVRVGGQYAELILSSGAHGDIYARATADKCYLYVNATNYVRAEDLRSPYVVVQQNGFGDCYLGLSQTNRFEYSINNSGNIYYNGDPAQLVNTGNNASSGKLIKK